MRLTPADKLQDAVTKLVGGNPGALNACISIAKSHPDRAREVFADFDFLSIYGPSIWLVFSDVCDREPQRVVQLLEERKQRHDIDPLLTRLTIRTTYDHEAVEALRQILCKFKPDSSRPASGKAALNPLPPRPGAGPKTSIE